MLAKPNLLFIFTDQQRYDTMACYGNDRIETPNLNALASESFVFERAYVTQPICTPARSSILTGQYPHTNGCTALNIPLQAKTKTIAEMVSDDYHCAYCGKWHLGDEIVAQHGFDDWVSLEDLYRQFYSKPEYLERYSSYHHYLIEHGYMPDVEREGKRVFGRQGAAQLPEEHVKARFLGREAARFIGEHSDDPFVLYVNFFEPHNPYTGPLDDLYDADSLPVGPHFRQRPSENASRLHQIQSEHYMSGGQHDGIDLTTEAGCRQLRAQYMGNVTLVDRGLGDIIQALEASGQADNTIIVYTSEHGEMMGDHGLFEKSVLYEEAARVPLLIRVPWLGAGQQFITGAIGQIDLVPTLLDLLGEPIPDELEGESKADVLRGETTLAGNDVFIEWNGPDARPIQLYKGGVPAEEWVQVKGAWRTIVAEGRWKLNLSTTDQCELYDLATDPT